MKHTTTFLMITALGISALSFNGCKGGNKDKQVPDTIVTDTSTAASEPVVVSGDEELNPKVKDVTKDFPSVTATVSGGEITLTGTISRDRLPTLMQSLSALHSKKINNQLTITK